MALDWNKEISFSGLAKSRPKSKDTYPAKTYMNLAVADRKTLEMRKVVPLAILLVILVAAFLKFGVFDFVGAVNAKQAQLAQQQRTLSDIEAQLSGYNGVLDEYSRYVSTQLANDGSTVSTLDALRLVDNVVRPRAAVSSLNYESNTLTLVLANTSLSSLSDLMSALNAQPQVANVSVSNAATGQSGGNDVLTAMTVTLKKADDAR